MIEEIKTLPNKMVIKIAEEVLSRAKTGEIQSLVATGLNDDGTSFNQFEVEGNVMIIIGELRLIERDIIDLHCDTRRKVAWDFVE